MPVQLVAPQSTMSSGLLHLDQTGDIFDDRRPKRDIHPPSKEIPTGPAAKRKRLPKWRSDPQLKYCHNIIREFGKKQYAEFMFPFMEPVDYEKLQIPDYPLIIKHPMDIGTIRKKLESDAYDNAEEFKTDVELVIKNCFTFNPENTPVHVMGVRMQNLFNRKWAGPPPPPTPPQAGEVAVDSDDVQPEEVEFSGN